MVDKLLKRCEAKAALRVGDKKLDELVRTGALSVVRLGSRTVRIAESAVRDLLERRTDRAR
jgi:excisionase family DNA binding protein